MSAPLLEIASIVKDYRGLRPLRIERLRIEPGQQTALVGLDQVSAEVLVNLVTGATLPERGTVAVFGRDSAGIADSAEWLALVDRFGIVSARAVLLGELSVVQNLAVPFSLEIEPLGAALRERAIAAGREVGLVDSDWDRPVSSVDPGVRLRVRLARALALDPAIVLLEHPTAELSRVEAAAIGVDIRAVLERRGAAGLTLTADRDFAGRVAARVLTLEAATGQLTEARRGWFRRRSPS